MNAPPENNPTRVDDSLKLFEDSFSSKKVIPLSTYRLQLTPDFTLADARKITPYLASLGVSHCYTSPFLAAGKGSQHGYDICDFNRINPELGGEEEYNRFAEELSRHQMGHILDFVPNHMGIADAKNKWWQDVLENGQYSPYAKFFDIEWNPAKAELKGKILLPILGNQYGVVLEKRDLQLDFKEGVFFSQIF